jgi:hypothetical protein
MATPYEQLSMEQVGNYDEEGLRRLIQARLAQAPQQMPIAQPQPAPQAAPQRALPLAIDSMQATMPRSLRLRQQIAELEGQGAGDDGGMSLLNALAAGYAGEQYAPVQAHFLKRAMAMSPENRTKAQIARLSREAEIADRQESAAALQRERLTEQRLRAGEQANLRRELAQLKGSGASPYFMPVQTGKGVYGFNTRTNALTPILVDGKTVIGSASDPALQGDIAGAKARGGLEAKSESEAKGAINRSNQLFSVINQAEGILKQGPTGSGVGAAVDTLGRVVGYSSESAQKAAELETISGWLVSNVPRMEGPQSNYDVQNYKEMAAKVGDRTVPVNERMAALQALRSLQEKYKHLNEGIVAGGAGGQPTASESAPLGVDPKVWNFMTPEERALWK